MRRPVRSQKKVSNRKLFNNGGFPTMGAQAQMPNPLNVNMGGTLPQANNIMAPSGILASSTELSNAVGDQALAQSFAPAVGMKSGGIASFANGGTTFTGQKIQDATMSTLNNLLENIGVRAKNVGGRLGTTANYLQSYVPPVLGGKAFTPAEPVPVESTIDATTYGTPFGVTKDFEWQTFNPVNNTTTVKDFTFTDIKGNDITARNWFNEPAFVTADRFFSIRGPEVGLDGVIKNMVDSLPNLENEIVSISQEIIARDPNIEKDDLRQQVSVALKTITEGNNASIQRIKQEGAANLYQDTQGQTPVDVTSAEYIEANKTPVDEIMEQMQDVSDYEPRTIDDSIVGENEIETDVDLAVSRWKATGYDNNFIETLRGEGKDDAFLSEVVARRELDYASPELGTKFYGEEEEIIPADSPRNITSYGDITSGEEEAGLKVDIDIPIPKEEEVDETDGSREGINIPGSSADDIDDLNKRNKAIANKPATEANVVEAASNAGEEIFIQQARGDEQETINETLDRFAKEFMDRMPEFKGKTESEKGWDLIALGSAIMGGTSSNSLTNIANGFLATADRFTEDDKAKRAYDNSIQMGAAKYALQKLATQEARDARREEQIEWMYADKDLTYKGKSYEKGSAIPVSMFDIMENGVPDGLIEGSVYSANIATINTVNSNIAKITSDAVKNATISETEETNILELQSKLSKSYKSSVTGRLYLGRAMDILKLNPKAIAGGSSVLREGWERFKNAFNFSEEFQEKFRTKATDADGNKWGDTDADGNYLNATRQEFNMNVRIAFQNLIPVALAGVQSANSISNRDVQFLADAFINAGALNENGLLSENWWKNKDTIRKQLEATNNLFLTNEQGFLKDMQNQFTRLQDRFRPAIDTSGQIASQRASNLVTENMEFLYSPQTGEVLRDETGEKIRNPNYIGSYRASIDKFAEAKTDEEKTKLGWSVTGVNSDGIKIWDWNVK